MDSVTQGKVFKYGLNLSSQSILLIKYLKIFEK